MKQRLSSLDLKILISEFEKSLKGYRLQNIYNLTSNNRSFLLKFSVPDSKFNVVLESGFKVYITDFQRPTQPEPSNFTTKLRKHLKTKRLTNIKQVGDDRIAVLEFSDGFYYLVLEFFSAGNIILLDSNLKILSLFRFVDTSGKAQEGQYDIGGTYTMFDKSLFAEEPQTLPELPFDKKRVLDWISDTKQAEKEKKKVLSVEKLSFHQASYLSSDLIHISLLQNGVKPSTSCLELLENKELLVSTVKALNETRSKFNALIETPVGEIDGYILSKKNPLFKENQEPSIENLEFIYHEFHPFEPIHKIKDDVKVEMIKGYNKTVDKFFTTLEMSKVSLSRQIHQANIEKRLQFVKDEHAKKLQALDEVQDMNFKKGYLINLYNEKIEQCKEAVQKLIDQKMDWKNIEKLIKVEQARGNEIAKMIKSLNLLKNEITVSLIDVDDDEANESDSASEDNDSGWDSDDSESESESLLESKRDLKAAEKNIKTVDVVIDITQSAFANSSRYFDIKKSAKQKQEKTAKSAVQAIKNSEQKIHQDLKKIQKEAKNNVEFKQLRPKYWFEKFFWFISSEGYLCIAGKDDNQIDSIYYRFFDNETDLLVSNDLENALKVFVKNPYKNKDIPPTTFMQAGIFSLTSTKAWENKMVTSPWYVKGCDISKKDFDGTILPSGLLNVSKEKNYLPPCQMVMGIGLLFIGDKQTFSKYKNAKEARDKELGLVSFDSAEGYASKIRELKSMLQKLQDQEKIAKESHNDRESVESVAAPSDGAEVESENEQFESDPVSPPTPYQQTQTKVRGKKNKLKKIKEKYGEQDEEERKLRMAVLGTLKQVEKAKLSQKEPFNNKEVNDRMSAAAKKDRRRQQQINQISKLIEELESRTEDADDFDENNDRDDDYAKEINSSENYQINIAGLLPSPNKTDRVIDCVPVFAPWSALNRYTYKVKLQPGNLKKGKTVADVTEFFKRHTKELQKQDADWYDSNNLIELINQQEFMMMLTASKFKVGNGSGNGSSKAKNGKEKGKKK